jgi:hypothetical protein
MDRDPGVNPHAAVYRPGFFRTFREETRARAAGARANRANPAGFVLAHTRRATARGGGLVPSRFAHARHVVRAAGIFVGGFTLFLVVRSWLIPSDFGAEGFYRAGARVEAMGKPLAYAGEETCTACHVDVDELRKTARHRALKCEGCHGPLLTHADDPSIKPKPIASREFCLNCHAKAAGKGAFLPQVFGKEHMADMPCVDCHKPHRPALGESRLPEVRR